MDDTYRMLVPTTRRYSIEIKDAETGDLVAFATVNWTAAQEKLAIALVSRLASDASRTRPGIARDTAPPRNTKSRYN